MFIRARAPKRAEHIICAIDAVVFRGVPVGDERKRTRGRAGDGMLIGVTKGYCSFLNECRGGKRETEYKGLGTEGERNEGQARRASLSALREPPIGKGGERKQGPSGTVSSVNDGSPCFICTLH